MPCTRALKNSDPVFPPKHEGPLSQYGSLGSTHPYSLSLFGPSESVKLQHPAYLKIIPPYGNQPMKKGYFNTGSVKVVPTSRLSFLLLFLLLLLLLFFLSHLPHLTPLSLLPFLGSASLIALQPQPQWLLPLPHWFPLPPRLLLLLLRQLRPLPPAPLQLRLPPRAPAPAPASAPSPARTTASPSRPTPSVVLVTRTVDGSEVVEPTEAIDSPAPSSTSKQESSGLGKTATIAISVAGGAVALILIAFIVVRMFRKTKRNNRLRRSMPPPPLPYEDDPTPKWRPVPDRPVNSRQGEMTQFGSTAPSSSLHRAPTAVTNTSTSPSAPGPVHFPARGTGPAFMHIRHVDPSRPLSIADDYDEVEMETTDSHGHPNNVAHPVPPPGHPSPYPGHGQAQQAQLYHQPSMRSHPGQPPMHSPSMRSAPAPSVPYPPPIPASNPPGAYGASNSPSPHQYPQQGHYPAHSPSYPQEYTVEQHPSNSPPPPVTQQLSHSPQNPIYHGYGTPGSFQSDSGLLQGQAPPSQSLRQPSLSPSPRQGYGNQFHGPSSHPYPPPGSRQ
ncbi:hypothetical protein BJ684DRAFT_15931 [Piptocephalis cylindrospora]|uniref:Uncharacterized protein n=1 Tax=Piptocephalis cylindrospora TaxID=1907219 RepID=A0A4P9Y4K0_9FUNG|nr:hypothetical protein BJ684DRAFT_15931 [Piptocephalis cylindrospora]|eukprot:RKP13694.1 hypothetical protein BJ684DRAFT_15931 [Piptocephalis cylindrospora]